MLSDQIIEIRIRTKTNKWQKWKITIIKWCTFRREREREKGREKPGVKWNKWMVSAIRINIPQMFIDYSLNIQLTLSQIYCFCDNFFFNFLCFINLYAKIIGIYQNFHALYLLQKIIICLSITLNCKNELIQNNYIDFFFAYTVYDIHLSSIIIVIVVAIIGSSILKNWAIALFDNAPTFLQNNQSCSLNGIS